MIHIWNDDENPARTFVSMGYVIGVGLHMYVYVCMYVCMWPQHFWKAF